MKRLAIDEILSVQRILFFFLLFITVPGFAYEAALEAKSQHRILILNSYHYGYAWSDNEVKGIMKILDNTFPDADILVEFLDAKHFPGSFHEQNRKKCLPTNTPLSLFL